MTFQLILRSVGRVLWFAIAGALCMALVGVVAGAITGGLLIGVPTFFDYLRGYVPPPSYFDTSWMTGSRIAANIASRIAIISGSIAFAVSGVLACFSVNPKQVFSKAFRFASRMSLAMMILGAVLGIVNVVVWGHFLNPTSTAQADAFIGYMWGVVGGFIIGTFYGAIVGAKHEIARQKGVASQHRVLDV